MFGTFRLVMVIALIGSLAGAGFYVNKLRSDNAILKANQIKLESAVEDQKAVIQDQKISYEKILDANKKLNITISTQKRELDDLNQRFNKNNRDIGKLAVDKTKIIEKIINKATDNSQRCFEILTGSPLTEKEKNATKKSEINPECPSVANPNYVPY
jgi:cell division protein FtsX|tara:strand:- start:3423 stop:3893 length:471 start_codon:yes stop_codon:yes gene_type:complete